MTVASAGALALELGGGALVLVALGDMFLTIFNYDGFTTLTTRFHRAWWLLVRGLAAPLPARARELVLSLGSASMLPASVGAWLGLEITGFALIFYTGIGDGRFRLVGASRSLGTAFYLSTGDISSLTFGDVVARGSLDRALVDLETMIGLATFTLALGYVVTAFGLLGTLETLHGRFRRNADDLEPLDRRRFSDAWASPGTDPAVDAFRHVDQRARKIASTGGDGEPYDRYCSWLPFAYMQQVVLDRVAERLGYARPAPIARI